MGVLEKLKKLDERLVPSARRDVYAPITRSERRIADAPRSIPIWIALGLGFIMAAGFELPRPYPQANNFLIFWAIFTAIALPLAAAGVERTRLDVARREVLLEGQTDADAGEADSA